MAVAAISQVMAWAGRVTVRKFLMPNAPAPAVAPAIGPPNKQIVLLGTVVGQTL